MPLPYGGRPGHNNYNRSAARCWMLILILWTPPVDQLRQPQTARIIFVLKCNSCCRQFYHSISIHFVLRRESKKQDTLLLSWSRHLVSVNNVQWCYRHRQALGLFLAVWPRPLTSSAKNPIQWMSDLVIISSPAITHISPWLRQKGHPDKISPVHQTLFPLYMPARPSFRNAGVHDVKRSHYDHPINKRFCQIIIRPIAWCFHLGNVRVLAAEHSRLAYFALLWFGKY